MTCKNNSCSIFVVCQKKHLPCPANAKRTHIIRNGYLTIAMQEQQSRMDSIDFKGDF